MMPCPSGQNWVGPGEATTPAAMPFPVAEAASVVHEGRVWIFGGIFADDVDWLPSYKVQVYDPVLDNWEVEADLPDELPGALFNAVTEEFEDHPEVYFVPYAFGKAVSLGGYIYLAFAANGWFDDYSPARMIRYDPSDGSIFVYPYEQLPYEFWPETVDGSTLAALGGVVYWMSHNNAAYLDPVTDSWANGVTPIGEAPFPSVWGNIQPIVYGAKVYATGQSNDGGKIAVFDPAVHGPSSEWDVIDGPADPLDLSYRDGYGVALLNDSLTFTGGSNSAGGDKHTRTRAYNIATDEWELLGDLPIPYHWHCSEVVDGELFIFGGYDEDWHSKTTVLRYGGIDTAPVENSLTVTFDTPAPHVFPVRFAVTAGHVDRRRLRAYFTVSDEEQNITSVTFTFRVPQRVDYVSFNLTADEEDLWRGNVRSYTPLHPGPVCLQIGPFVVTGGIGDVTLDMESGIPIYSAAFAPPPESPLDRVVPLHTARDPARQLLANGAIVTPAQLVALRKQTPRNVAWRYFARSAREAHVPIIIDPDVVGAEYRLPYRDVWSGRGKTFADALEEVFGFAKPRIYVDGAGRIRVKRRSRPEEFLGDLEAPEKVTIKGVRTDTLVIAPTYFAAPAFAAKLDVGGSPERNEGVIYRKFNSRGQEGVRYLAEWYSAATLTNVPVRKGRQAGVLRALPVTFRAAKPIEGAKPAIVKDGKLTGWNAMAVKLRVTP